MLWKRGRRSDNVVGADSGGSPRMPGGRGGMGIGGLLIVVVVALFLGKNPAELLSLLKGMQPEILYFYGHGDFLDDQLCLMPRRRPCPKPKKPTSSAPSSAAPKTSGHRPSKAAAIRPRSW